PRARGPTTSTSSRNAPAVSTTGDRAVVSTEPDVGRAVRVLRRGGLVAFPTETVYGLGADAESDDALARLYAVKGRPTDHPVIVQLAHTDRIDQWAASVSDAARVLTERFWPGPLTVVVPAAPRVSRVAT